MSHEKLQNEMEALMHKHTNTQSQLAASLVENERLREEAETLQGHIPHSLTHSLISLSLFGGCWLIDE